MNDFEIKKEKWLKEVSDTCHEFAIKIDLDFYVFQTAVHYNPDEPAIVPDGFLAIGVKHDTGERDRLVGRTKCHASVIFRSYF